MDFVTAKISWFDRVIISKTSYSSWPTLNIGSISIGHQEVNVRYAYYFIASTWGIEYYSEDFPERRTKIMGLSWDIWEIFSTNHLMYNPTSNEENLKTVTRAIEELDSEMKDAGFLKKQALQLRLNSLLDIKSKIEIWEAYMEVNGHKLRIWDEVKVYIDPKNPNIRKH